jgi:hypothetical protein
MTSERQKFPADQAHAGSWRAAIGGRNCDKGPLPRPRVSTFPVF